MAYNNIKMHKARNTKNDEFKTCYENIEKEIVNYEKSFYHKTVYCPCDDRDSNFYLFFKNNFKKLNLKYLRATSYNENGKGKLLGYDGITEAETDLNYNGDMFDKKTELFFKNSDIVVTNPPFSLFSDFIDLLYKFGTQFLIIGNLNAINYKDVFPYFKDNKMWMGSTMFNCGSAYFIANKDTYDPDKTARNHQGYEKDGIFYWRVNGVRWFTNIPHNKRNNPIELSCKYSKDKYPKYDNCDAIECGKVSEIPTDYEGVMGVPISFIDKYCPEQFTIIGQMVSKKKEGLNFGYPLIDGKKKFSRILIQNKQYV